MNNKPLLALKQTSARIEFLRQGEQLVDKNGTLRVKNIAEKWTKGQLAIYQVNKKTRDWEVDERLGS